TAWLAAKTNLLPVGSGRDDPHWDEDRILARNRKFFKEGSMKSGADPHLAGLRAPRSRQETTRIRGPQNEVRTTRHLRTDCGWRNPEAAPNNCLERRKPLASKADCIRRDAPPQTSGTPDR